MDNVNGWEFWESRAVGNESAPIQLAQCWFTGWPFPEQKCKYIFQRTYMRKQFYQTAFGNCYGLKLPKCWLQFKEINFLCYLLKFSAHFRSLLKGSPYSITARRVPELIPVLGSQPAGDVNHKPDGRLPLLSARPAVTVIEQHSETVTV